MTQTNLKKQLQKKGDWDSPEQEAMINLLRTSSLFTCRADRLFRSHGISGPQYNILRILRGQGKGLPSLEIASQMIAIVPDITRLLDRLETAGYVKRERSTKDRRIVLISISEAGKTLLGRLDEPVRQQEKDFLGHLTRKELSELSRLLTKARDNEPQGASM